MNILRLCLMTWSPDAYGWSHGIVGANIYGLFLVALVQIAINEAKRRG